MTDEILSLVAWLCIGISLYFLIIMAVRRMRSKLLVLIYSSIWFIGGLVSIWIVEVDIKFPLQISRFHSTGETAPLWVTMIAFAFRLAPTVAVIAATGWFRTYRKSDADHV